MSTRTATPPPPAARRAALAGAPQAAAPPPDRVLGDRGAAPRPSQRRSRPGPTTRYRRSRCPCATTTSSAAGAGQEPRPGADRRRDLRRVALPRPDVARRRQGSDADHARPPPTSSRDKSGGTAFEQGDLATPQVNIAYGSWYLRYLLDRYDDRETIALAAYNAGKGNVDRWLADAEAGGRDLQVADIPFPETRWLRGEGPARARRLPPDLSRRARAVARAASGRRQGPLAGRAARRGARPGDAARGAARAGRPRRPAHEPARPRGPRPAARRPRRHRAPPAVAHRADRPAIARGARRRRGHRGARRRPPRRGLRARPGSRPRDAHLHRRPALRPRRG